MENKQIEVFLQYYYPHVSGLTNAAVDICEYMRNKENYAVTVYCIAKPGEPRSEVVNGVIVRRYKPWFRLGRASFSPAVLHAAYLSSRKKSIIHIHAPYPEAAVVSWLTRKNPRKIMTYQCDSGITDFKSKIYAWLLDESHRFALLYLDKIIFSSEDYRVNSRIGREVELEKRACISVPCRVRKSGRPKYRRTNAITIGFLGRASSEKGLLELVRAMDYLPSNFHLLIAGPTPDYESYGEEIWILAGKSDRIQILGEINDSEISDFYESIDVFVLPSTNSYEAFGIVQVEAMSFGVPSVVSDLPGLRSIVSQTGFGSIAKVKDPADIANAIIITSNKQLNSDEIKTFVRNNYMNPIPLEHYATILKEGVKA